MSVIAGLLHLIIYIEETNIQQSAYSIQIRDEISRFLPSIFMKYGACNLYSYHQKSFTVMKIINYLHEKKYFSS